MEAPLATTFTGGLQQLTAAELAANAVSAGFNLNQNSAHTAIYPSTAPSLAQPAGAATLQLGSSLGRPLLSLVTSQLLVLHQLADQACMTMPAVAATGNRSMPTLPVTFSADSSFVKHTAAFSLNFSLIPARVAKLSAVLPFEYPGLFFANVASSELAGGCNASLNLILDTSLAGSVSAAKPIRLSSNKNLELSCFAYKLDGAVSGRTAFTPSTLFDWSKLWSRQVMLYNAPLYKISRGGMFKKPNSGF